jgi:hypothetical protein
MHPPSTCNSIEKDKSDNLQKMQENISSKNSKKYKGKLKKQLTYI